MNPYYELNPLNKPVLRVPFTESITTPIIWPPEAASIPGAVAALRRFLAAPLPPHLTRSSSRYATACTAILTGAGISVASGLPDYRGTHGTYRAHKTYRPIFYHEFLRSHEARKRYWARSFLGWPNTARAAPNAAHYAIRDLGGDHLGLLSAVITQNVDSLHARAHPGTPTVELHGTLATVTCTSCGGKLDRSVFQTELARLNPRWAALLDEALRAGAFDVVVPSERGSSRGIQTNPDGDVDVPDAPYSTFRYPPCPACLAAPQTDRESQQREVVATDADGAWAAPSTGGILKPSVVMFGENVAPAVKTAAERVIESSGRLIVTGTSLAAYSAWRLVRQARMRSMPIAIINAGGVRGEDYFGYNDSDEFDGDGGDGGDKHHGVRTELLAEELLPELVRSLRMEGGGGQARGCEDGVASSEESARGDGMLS